MWYIISSGKVITERDYFSIIFKIINWYFGKYKNPKRWLVDYLIVYFTDYGSILSKSKSYRQQCSGYYGSPVLDSLKEVHLLDMCEWLIKECPISGF